MIKMQCDPCGAQEETSGVFLPFPRNGLPFFRPELPEGWRRVEVPMPDGSAWERHLCPQCVRRLWDLFQVPYDRTEPTKCVRCGHAPSTHGGASDCGVLVDGRACGCALSPVECLDEGWAHGTDSDHLHDFGLGLSLCTVQDCGVSWGEFHYRYDRTPAQTEGA